MAEIIAAMRYSSEQQELIRSLLSASDFSHHRWQDEDLQSLRCALRDHYRQEQRGLCAYCRNPISLTSPHNSHVEHVAPKAKYVQFIFEPKNLCVICADCNAIKQSQDVMTSPDPLRRQPKRYPRSSTAFNIVHPHFDRWDDHILRVHGFYVDRTPKGHFTIGACVLNRKIRQFGWDSTLTESGPAAEAVRRLVDGAEPSDRAAALAALVHALLPSSGSVPNAAASEGQRIGAVGNGVSVDTSDDCIHA